MEVNVAHVTILDLAADRTIATVHTIAIFLTIYLPEIVDGLAGTQSWQSAHTTARGHPCLVDGLACNFFCMAVGGHVEVLIVKELAAASAISLLDDARRVPHTVPFSARSVADG